MNHGILRNCARTIAMLLISLASLPWTASAFAQGPSGDDREFSQGNITVTIQGHSGKFTYWNRGAIDGSKKYKIEMNGLYETTADGDRLATRTFNTFANQDFAFSPLTDYLYPTTSTLATDDAPTTPILAKNIDFITSLDVDGTSITLKVRTFLFVTTGTILVDGAAFAVRPGDLKFNVEINDWPFAAPDDRLVLEMAVKTPSITPSESDGTLNLGNGGFLALAQTALIDSAADPDTGLTTGTLATVDAVTSSTGSVGRICLSFPYFDRDLVYDPLLLSREERELEVAPIRVRIAGHSGKIQFWNDLKQSGGEKLFAVEMNGLAEWDDALSTWTVHRFPTFANQDFEFSDLQAVEYPGDDEGTTVSALNIDFFAPLRVGDTDTSLTVKTYLFREAGEIAVDGVRTHVEAGWLKFNVQIENWPFLATSNTLVLDLAVKTPGSHPSTIGDVHETIDLGDRTFMVLADTAVVDAGAVVPVESTLSGGESSSVGRIEIRFPSFQERLVYDPLVYDLDGPTNVGRTGWGLYR